MEYVTHVRTMVAVLPAYVVLSDVNWRVDGILGSGEGIMAILVIPDLTWKQRSIKLIVFEKNNILSYRRILSKIRSSKGVFLKIFRSNFEYKKFLFLKDFFNLFRIEYLWIFVSEVLFTDFKVRNSIFNETYSKKCDENKIFLWYFRKLNTDWRRRKVPFELQ